MSDTKNTDTVEKSGPKRRGAMAFVAAFAVVAVAGGVVYFKEQGLSPYDLKRVKEFALSSLPPLPTDSSNRIADNSQAAQLGEKLFFDPELSSNSAVSCSLCHLPNKGFQDGIPVGFGIEQVRRRTMPLRGIQWGNWFFWDGRKDSQWSQALGPLETPAEHGMTRDMVAREVLARYRREYESLFGTAPDVTLWPYRVSPLVEGQEKAGWEATPENTKQEISLVFANVGKVLAAYQRTLLPEENRADRFFEASLKGATPKPEDKFTPDELAGFRLFTGKAKCDNCHSGPLYTDHFFHNTGVVIANPDKPDMGRAEVVKLIKEDEFSCLGPFSDAKPDECRELKFMSEDEVVFQGSFKTPSLRGVSLRPPYMHAGQIKTLEAVVEHYVARNDPFAEMPEMDGSANRHGSHNEAPMIELSEREKAQLVAFLKTL